MRMAASTPGIACTKLRDVELSRQPPQSRQGRAVARDTHSSSGIERNNACVRHQDPLARLARPGFALRIGAAAGKDRQDAVELAAGQVDDAAPPKTLAETRVLHAFERDLGKAALFRLSGIAQAAADIAGRQPDLAEAPLR